MRDIDKQSSCVLLHLVNDFNTYSHVPYFISKSNIILFDQLQESKNRYLNHSIRILKPKLRVIARRWRHHVQLSDKWNCLLFNPNNVSIMPDIRQRIINKCSQFPFRTTKCIFYSSAIYKLFIEMTFLDSRAIFNISHFVRAFRFKCCCWS